MPYIPLVSVIIPTRGRDQCVRQTLRDLAAQSYSNFDIWIVDQNDKPLEGLAKEAAPAKLVHEKMPALGSHAGRNHAIFRSDAELFIFVDDDVRVEKDFVSMHVSLFEQSPQRVAAIAGRVVQPRDGFTDAQMREMGSPARYSKFTGQISGNFVGFEPANVHHIHECNFSARSSALRTVGGFNEEFRGNAYFEGADLALRLIAAGFEVAYRPEVTLVHLQDGSGGNRLSDKARHTYWYLRNYGLLNSLHMHKLGLPLYGAYGLLYVAGKAVKNSSFEIAKEGARGLLDGLRYFAPGAQRVRTRPKR